MLTTFILISWAKYITCIDITSNGSSATCPATYHLTSCGVKSQNTSTNIIDANAPNTCRHDTQTNTIYARCCPLPTYHSSTSAIHVLSAEIWRKNAVISISCLAPSQELIGCMVHTQNGPFYGVYSGDNACTVPTEDSKDGQVFTLCYDTSLITDGFELTCVSIDSVWDDQSNNSSVSCPTDKGNYFMTSCTGYSADATLTGYLIFDDICIVTATTPSRANAICCRMSKMVTDSPTSFPSLQSTTAPTSNPSKTNAPFPSPTIYPSTMPTIHPSHTTAHPSNDPTRKLSIELTIAVDAPTPSTTQAFEQSRVIDITVVKEKDDQADIIGFYDELGLFQYILIALGVLVIGCLLFVMVSCVKPCRHQREFTKKTHIPIMEMTLSDNPLRPTSIGHEQLEQDEEEEEEETMVLSENPLRSTEECAEDEEEKMGESGGPTMTCSRDILMKDICGTGQASLWISRKRRRNVQVHLTEPQAY